MSTSNYPATIEYNAINPRYVERLATTRRHRYRGGARPWVFAVVYYRFTRRYHQTWTGVSKTDHGHCWNHQPGAKLVRDDTSLFRVNMKSDRTYPRILESSIYDVLEDPQSSFWRGSHDDCYARQCTTRVGVPWDPPASFSRKCQHTLQVLAPASVIFTFPIRVQSASIQSIQWMDMRVISGHLAHVGQWRGKVGL